MASDDDIPLELTFPDGEGPEVTTGVFCHLFGGCESCPGILTAAQAKAAGLNFAEGTLLDAMVCVHWCHQDAPKA